jgi:hypothetical protein
MSELIGSKLENPTTFPPEIGDSPFIGLNLPVTKEDREKGPQAYVLRENRWVLAYVKDIKNGLLPAKETASSVFSRKSVAEFNGAEFSTQLNADRRDVNNLISAIGGNPVYGRDLRIGEVMLPLAERSLILFLIGNQDTTALYGKDTAGFYLTDVRTDADPDNDSIKPLQPAQIDYRSGGEGIYFPIITHGKVRQATYNPKNDTSYVTLDTTQMQADHSGKSRQLACGTSVAAYKRYPAPQNNAGGNTNLPTFTEPIKTDGDINHFYQICNEDPFVITQEKVNAFINFSHDNNRAHRDPEYMANSCFGINHTIAHGLFTLAWGLKTMEDYFVSLGMRDETQGYSIKFQAPCEVWEEIENTAKLTAVVKNHPAKNNSFDFAFLDQRGLALSKGVIYCRHPWPPEYEA